MPQNPYYTTFPFEIDWASGFKISYTYKTEILTAKSQREQRIATRISPRKIYEFSCLLSFDQRRLRDAILHAWGEDEFRIADMSRSTKVVAATPSTVTVSGTPDWVSDGRFVIVIDKGRIECLEIVSALGGQVFFVAAPTQQISIGATLHPAPLCYLADSSSAQMLSDEVTRQSFVFSEIPASSPTESSGFPSSVFDQKEVFEEKYNWASSVDLEFISHNRDVDFGTGKIRRFNSANRNTRILKAGFLCTSASSAEELRQFFFRRKGQQRDFRYSTFANDLPILSSPNATTIVVKDSIFGQTMSDLVVYNAIEIAAADGSVFRSKIITVTHAGLNSTLTLADPINVSLVGATVSWMPVVRFASDTAIFDWKTDQVCEVQMAFRTIDDTFSGSTDLSEDPDALYIASVGVRITGIEVAMR
jgi:hypothetical protein